MIRSRSHILEAFIRSSINELDDNKKNDYDFGDLSWADEEEETGPRGGSFMAVAGNIKNKDLTLIGKKFALEDNGEPAVVVMAENDNTSDLLVRKYSKSTYSDAQIIKSLYAKLITGQDPIIEDIASRKGGWIFDPKMMASLQLMSATTNARRPRLPISHFLVDKAAYGLKEPRAASTLAGQTAILNFKCIIELPDAVKILFNTSPESPEWALAAACFYEYANSGEQIVISAVAGTAIGAALGGLAGAASGFGMGLVYPELVLRMPVLIWAHKNKEDEIFYATLAYCAIIILCEGFNKFLSVRTEALAGKFAKSTTDFIIRTGEKLLPYVTKGYVTQETYRAITSGLSSAVKDQTVWFSKFALMIAQLAAAIGAFTGIEKDTAKSSQAVYKMLTSNVDIQAIEGSSRAKMLKSLQEQYPDY